MNFEIGEILRIDGEVYIVVGKVTYADRNDAKAVWTEYCLHSQKNRREKWLSCDDIYGEYSISEVVSGGVSISEYHTVDKGVEEVLATEGRVDVERGERATFVEYEDATEEKIISIEKWEDGEELSVGYYLDVDEIERIGGNQQKPFSVQFYSQTETAAPKSNGKGGKLVLAMVILVVVITNLGRCSFGFGNGNTIAKYLENSSAYEYKTSVTGTEKEKADVYVTQYSIDQAVRDIIDGIEGNTEDIQQNEEDGDDSVTILTEKEYCIVYTSEDDETLVQVSSRKYAYRSDRDLYRGRRHTNRYYRRYYYSRAYRSDADTYKKYDSPYSSYSDDTLDADYSSSYDLYSSSVRQSSINSRSSSGGGLSSGK